MEKVSCQRRGLLAAEAWGVLAVLALGALASCSAERTAGVQHVPGTDSAPSAFVGRPRFKSCGDVRYSAERRLPADAVACMNRAFQEGAELVVRMTSVEGDPITNYIRVGPGITGVDIFIDATQDKFSNQGWSHQQCPGATSITEFGTCQPG